MSRNTAATVIQTIVYSPPKQGYGTTTTFAPSYIAQGLITWLVTWTNLGPLTTTYTAPSSCLSVHLGGLTVYSTDTDGDIDSSWPCDWETRTAPPTWIECQPSATAYSSLIEATPSAAWMTYLSPGLYCPSNYSTAMAVTLDSQDIVTRTFDGYLLRTTGTHVYCCPTCVLQGLKNETSQRLTHRSGYFSSLGNCVTNVATAVSTTLCNPNYGTSAAPFIWRPGQQDVVVQRTAYPVYMIHQQSDTPGLSPSSKIAIGVTVPVVVLLGIIFGGFFLMRRLRRKKASKSNASSSADAQEAKSRVDEPIPRRPLEPEQVNEDVPENLGEGPGWETSTPAAPNQTSERGEDARGGSRVPPPKRPSAKTKRGWNWV